jgi:Transposase DDE domain group 1
MSKVKQSSREITPFGGLNFIYEALSSLKIDQCIDNQIGFRNYRAEYSYSDIVFSLLGNSMCNGEFVSDLEYLKKKYKNQYFNSIPSPDTVEYACQELKVPNKVVRVESKGKTIEHQINSNTKLNKALVNLCVYTKQLQSGKQSYTLDYDNVVVENEKQDAKKSYKMVDGYHPGFAFIGKLPVHIVNRNGNTPAKYDQDVVLKECLTNLDSNKIEIKNFRGDSASYQKKVIELLEDRCCFYIRNVSSESFRTACSQAETDWKRVEINYQIIEVGSVKFKPFGGTKEYRVVVTRTPNKDGQIDLFTGNAYSYYGIITNDLVVSDKDVILFYNQRGNDSENGNKNLLNDFNLSRLPFPDMDTNTVYMLLMAVCNVLFELAKKILVHNKVEGISMSDRVKRVCYRYISVCTTYVKHAGQRVLKIFSAQKYSTLELIV